MNLSYHDYDMVSQVNKNNKLELVKVINCLEC